MSLSKLELLEHVKVAYSHLEAVVRQEGQLEVVTQHFRQLWEEGSSVQTRIRSFCLLQYVEAAARE